VRRRRCAGPRPEQLASQHVIQCVTSRSQANPNPTCEKKGLCWSTFAKCAAWPPSCSSVSSAVLPLPSWSGVARLVKLACAGTQLPSDLRHAGCGSSKSEQHQQHQHQQQGWHMTSASRHITHVEGDALMWASNILQAYPHTGITDHQCRSRCCTCPACHTKAPLLRMLSRYAQTPCHSSHLWPVAKSLRACHTCML
jgi:hypothetical protein